MTNLEAGTYNVTVTNNCTDCIGIESFVVEDGLELNNTQTVSICDNNLPYILPDGSAVNTAGNYSVTLQSMAGCDSTVNVNLIFNALSVFDTTSNHCAGDGYT